MTLPGSIRVRLSVAVAAAAAVFLSLGVWYTLDRAEASARASVREIEEQALDELVALSEELGAPLDTELFETFGVDAEVEAAAALVADLDAEGVYPELIELFGLDDGAVILLASDGSLVEVDPEADSIRPVAPEQLDPADESRILPTFELFEVAGFLLGEDEPLIDDFGLVEVPLGEGAVLVGAGELDQVAAGIDALRRPLWFGAAVLTVLTGVVAWVLTGRALRPVTTMARRVGEISGGTLHERIPEPDTSDEISELARTMNGMLDRLESSDQRRRRFVSDASHELRSPVATIRSVTEVAAQRPGQADWPGVADDVLAETRRLEDLVADLLQLARADEGRLVAEAAEVDLDDLVLTEIGRPRSVPIDGGGVGAARVQGRPDELQRMVRHLVDNAARHAATRVTVHLRTDGPLAYLTVDDDGPGIAPADRALVFERFVRLDQARTRDRGGAGLGLAVAAAVVSAHGGSIEVGERPSGGARFEVRLPLAQR